MRLIKVKKSSQNSAKGQDETCAGDLGDSLIIEVGELNAPHRAAARSPRSATKKPSKRKRRVARSPDSEFVEGGFAYRGTEEIDFQSGDGADQPCSPRRHKSTQAKTADSTRKSSRNKHTIGDVYNRGIYLLSMREHSVKELTDKLAQKFPASSVDEIETAVTRLSDHSYVSDERFTEAYIRQRSNRGLGPVKIRAELYKKGIKNNLIDEYLDLESPAWVASALEQYQKKFGNTQVVDYKEWARRARFLQGRGYSSNHIKRSIPEIGEDVELE